MDSVRAALVEELGEDGLSELAARYAEAYEGCYDGEELDAYIEEICADAYAGMDRLPEEKAKIIQKAAKSAQDAQQAAEKTGGTRGPPEKYSVGASTDGTPIAVVDNDILSHIDTSAWDDAKKAEAKAAAKDALLSFKDGVEVAGVDYRVNRTSRREYTRSNDTERLYRKSTDAFADKMRSAEIADDIITATTSWARDGRLKHPRTDSFVDFLHGDVLIQAGANQYIANTVVGVTANGEYVFYDVVDMTPTSFQQKTGPSTTASGANAVSDIQESPDMDSIRGAEPKSQEKFSASGGTTLDPYEALKIENISNFIRQIFNGRARNDTQGVSCDAETRFYGRPSGRSVYGKSNGNTHNGTIRLFARKRYFASCASFLHTFFWQDRNGTKQQTSEAFAVWRGRAAQWTRPAACGGARDMELGRTNARGATVAVAQ